ncbi:MULTISPECIES: glycosyltransferase family 2 protein [unclassified Halobacteriovorax]|uniref:glycosyltransferase family 2 protein n=1 Tax=unclassified Halobacteriovorax TaxID=2639665 RepID=UPI00399B2ABB
MNKLVSVIIPVYNASQYIIETLASVVVQTYNNLEIIVVDDCSKDNSVDVVQDYLSKCDVKFILKRCEKNFGGPAGPRNIGVECSSGDYIAFLDADDIWHPKKLEVQIKLLENSNALLVSSLKYDFLDGDNYYFNNNLNKLETEIITYNRTLFKNTIYLSSVLISRKKLIYKFNEAKEFSGVEDYYLWLSLLKNGSKAILIKENLIAYRILLSSLSRNKFKHSLKVLRVLKSYKTLTFPFYFMTYFIISYFRIFKKSFVK